MSTENPDWTLFSHHAHVLICLAENPRSRLREVAERVGVTERTAMRLIDRLDRAGVIKRVRHGRRNYYEINAEGPLPHPLEAAYSAERILSALLHPVASADEQATNTRQVKKSGRAEAIRPDIELKEE